jgi:cellulose synthase/poly-beta-1,6-N-acetylglucosamine synthase-like glycosyltransferase
MGRWDALRAAVSSVLSQDPGPAQVVVVIDHNAELAARASGELQGCQVLESDGAPGLSGARNTGLAAAAQPVTVFLDDDARARPGWLAALIDPYRVPDVVATGGHVEPCWPGLRPRWLPREFDWVVGCSYLGMPESPGAIRNPIGANMSMRTQAALEAGGFHSAVGRVGNPPAGCEETELAIRLTAGKPGATIYYTPGSAVDHHIAPERVKFGYFLRRCWYEGLSKATVVQLAGASAGLRSERRQVALVIPRQVARELGGLARGDWSALLRVWAAAGGLTAAAAGFLTGQLRYQVRRR